jgi:DNA-binding transcriptional MerR regulator
MKIGELAGQVGVSTQTIRFYERTGLLSKPGRTPSGYRSYPESVVTVVRFIKQSQEIGYTLAEIKKLLSFHDAGGNMAEIRDLALLKIADISKRIEDLSEVREQLELFVANCNCGTKDQPGCPPIEQLDFTINCRND